MQHLQACWGKRLVVAAPAVGIDPLPFYSEYKKKSFATPLEYLRSLPVATKVRVRSNRTPDFVRRYPTLCKAPAQGSSVSAWLSSSHTSSMLATPSGPPSVARA